MIKKVPTKDMSHNDWLEARRHSIGGSDAAAIVGLNPYTSRYELWADKLGRLPPKEENEAMRIGKDFEDYVAKRFCEATGKKVRRERNIIINTDFPFAHANVDRMIIGEKAGLECKTTSVLNLKKFNDGNYPPVYYVQCQHYMMVTGLPKWYLAVLILGKEFLWFEIPRCETDIEALATAEKQFWEYVKAEKEPPVDGTASCSNAIGILYPDSEDTEIDLTPLHSALEIRSRLDKQIKELSALKEEQDNKIKAYMETSERGFCDKYKVLWKTFERSSFDKNALLEDYPDIDFSKYFKTLEFRRFQVIENEEVN